MPAATALLCEATFRALGEVVAEQRREWAREMDLLRADARATLAELRATIGELEARCAAVEALALERAAAAVQAALAELRSAADGPDRQEWARETELLRADGRATIADLRATVAELEARCAGLEAAAFDRAAAAVEAALKSLRQPADGRSVTLEDVEPLVREAVGRAVAAIPPALPGPAGLLPLVVEWAGGVCYRADVVTCDGATWQAVRDTGERPGGSADWICLAAAGRDGADGLDGRSFAVRGLWVGGNAYAALDVVTLDGSSFVATRDDPGPCPGDGWRLLAGRGKTGKPGPAGDRGAPGEKGTPGRSVSADELGGLVETIVGRMLAGAGR